MFKKLFGGLMGSRPDSSSAPSFEQRRKTARRPCEIEVEATVGRKGHMVNVVDMGVAGLRLHTFSPISVKPKALIRVTYPDVIPKHDVLSTECVVRWSRIRDADGSQFIGVEFKDQKALARSWVKAKMQNLGFQSYNLKEQRSQHRVVAHLLGTIDIGGGSLHCVIVNIGLGGLYIQLRQPIRAGATIVVKVAGTPLLPATSYTVTVRHQQQPEPGDPFGYGCAFQDLSSEQAEAIKELMSVQHDANWERTEDWPDLLYISASNAQAEEEVVIPDLASILAEDPDEEETP
jgi:hypothetical protein